MNECRVGIVGAGLAGVGLAHALAAADGTGGEALASAAPDAVPATGGVHAAGAERTADARRTAAGTADSEASAVSFDVTILEKSRGVGGRAATRRRDGRTYYYDHGANYVKDADERTVTLVESLGEDGLVAMRDPVWPFAGDGTITESERDPEPKYTWETGITQFAKRLLSETDAAVRNGTRAAQLSFDPGSDEWRIRDTDDETHGPFDAVVCTPPAPQTAELLAATSVGGTGGKSSTAGELQESIDRLRERVTGVPFRTTRTVVLGYEAGIERPWYALVNTDGDHAIGWLSREECKRGHVPDGESVLIVQMAPDYSERTYDDPADEVATDTAARVAELLETPRLAEPDWYDDQGWRYAQPEEPLVDAVPEPVSDAGLYAAGDWLVEGGKGRVHEAYWQGVSVAQQVASRVTD